MEVKAVNDGLITNLEVLSIIQDRRIAREKIVANASTSSILASAQNRLLVENQHRESIETKVLKYLSSHEAIKKNTDMGALRKCLKSLKRLQLPLSENEMIQIANLLPSSDVEFYSIIDTSAGAAISPDDMGLIQETFASAVANFIDTNTDE